jgi:pimeloyl-ACP methyl ester carboxylesterase
MAEGFPASPELSIWNFLRSVADYDPMPYWILTKQPVFFGFGEKDEEDNVPVQESVRRIKFAFSTAGKTNYEIVVAPKVGHSLWLDNAKFHPTFIERLAAWLQRYVTV